MQYIPDMLGCTLRGKPRSQKGLKVSEERNEKSELLACSRIVSDKKLKGSWGGGSRTEPQGGYPHPLPCFISARIKQRCHLPTSSEPMSLHGWSDPVEVEVERIRQRTGWHEPLTFHLITHLRVVWFSLGFRKTLVVPCPFFPGLAGSLPSYLSFLWQAVDNSMLTSAEDSCLQTTAQVPVNPHHRPVTCYHRPHTSV